MRSEKHLSLFLAILLFSAGAYLLLGSMRHPGHFAELSVLIGALLATFALAMMVWSYKLHARTRALQRHMRGQ